MKRFLQVSTGVTIQLCHIISFHIQLILEQICILKRTHFYIHLITLTIIKYIEHNKELGENHKIEVKGLQLGNVGVKKGEVILEYTGNRIAIAD